MSQNIKGTFASASSSILGVVSDVLVIPSGVTSAALTTSGLDASNTIKTQKTTNSGASWADVATYNSEQAATAITVAHGEQWRLFCVSQEAVKQISYSFSVES